MLKSYGKPVTSKLSEITFESETFTGRPFNIAPFPATAVKSSSVTGFNTMPSTIFPFNAKAIETEKRPRL